MIYVNRNNILMPEVFFSKEIEIAKTRLTEFYKKSKDSRSQQKYSTAFEPELREKFIAALRELFNGKCAYCESIIPLETSHSIYDHFRPKNGARGLDKEFSNDHYWWLTYEWENLYYSCQKCNQYKSTWFPVEGKRTKIGAPYLEIIRNEKSLLIDPCQNKPEKHLIYTETAEVDFLTSEGRTTIEILKLNRSDLIKSRRHTLAMLKVQWDFFSALLMNQNANMVRINEIAEQWRLMFAGNSSGPYLGIQRQMLTKWLKASEYYDYLFNRDFKVFQPSEIIKQEALTFSEKEIEQFANKKELSLEEKEEINEKLPLASSRHIYVEKIELKNFKCFSHLEIDFTKNTSIQESKRNDNNLFLEPWVLFLGENGIGKTSILKALAIGLCGNEYIKELKISGSDILKKETES